MLKLHSLEINGFKSFVDPVEVRFADGITAIVGPNGCGKSNLSDAITWVLGEQSAKSLRGRRMEDVIFSGAEKRKPVGAAEVTLTLSSDPGFEHAVDGRLAIGRRVFRTGESQYRLNGKVVRLKEIRDLLMDTGLGIRAYSVIEQGKIGMILSGKPQERRKLLEEAAGITRYKARKRLAEIKLEEATANLMRLDDIIAEVQRSLRSLKRQAGAARRFHKRQREYRELLRDVLLGRWALLRERLDALETALAELGDRDAELAAALARDEAALAAGREELDRLAAELGLRHQHQAQIAATIEGRQEFLKGGRQRIEEYGERLTKGRDEALQRRQQRSDFDASLGTLDVRTRELLEERDEAARQVAEGEEKIAVAGAAVEAAEARLGELGQAAAETRGAVEAGRSQLQQAQVENERRDFRRRHLEEEGARLGEQVADADRILAEIDAGLTEDGRQADASAAHGAERREALETLLGRERRLDEERRELEAHLAGLRQRRRILVELSEEHAARRATLTDELRAAGVEKPRFLSDLISPAEGWEGGLDHFLGDLADAVVLDAGGEALALALELAERDTAAIFLHPIPASPAEPGTSARIASSVTPLAEAIDLPAELAASLPPAYLVDGAEEAQRLAADHPGSAFISRDRLWAEGGVLRVRGAGATPGVLARGRELEEIEHELPAGEERLRLAGESRTVLVEKRTATAAEIHRVDEELGELRRRLAVARARRQDVDERRQRIFDRRAGLIAEGTTLGEELAAGKIEHERLTVELAAGEARLGELAEAVDRARAEVDKAREAREVLRTEGAGRRGRLELLEERVESHHQEAARVRRQIVFAEEQLQIWAREGEDLESRRSQLELDLERAEEELQAALERRAEAQEQVLEQQARLDEQRQALRGLEEAVRTTRGSRDELRGELEGLRVDRATAGQDAGHLSATYREEFRKAIPGTLEAEPASTLAEDSTEEATEETSVEEAAAETEDASGRPPTHPAEDEGKDGTVAAEPWVEDEVEIPEPDASLLAEQEAELARLKLAVERLGPVNVLAAEEYEESLEREGFLSTQRTDVAESVTSLRQTIREINATSSERFQETFEQVNATFGETFSHLFRGGEAEMRLLDEEDVLESGIEIIARPPGKRPQNIMLLSGGEKALAAIALLFSLFRAKPSPFCILDEVDAPLDDANILRFVDTLQEMARETQFLIITHNKLTMEVASTLYGVTMEERGISKLVSVELDDVDPAEPEAISA